MPTCVHILKNAQPECTGIIRIVTDLAKRSRAFGYEIWVLFLGDGPLVNAMQDAGIEATAISWTGDRSDLTGAWRVWRWMQERPIDIAHLHHGGVSVRALCHLAGATAVIQHVHGEILEPDLNSVSQLRFNAADAVIACSQAAAEILRGCTPEVVYAGIEVGDCPPSAPPLLGPLRLGVLSRLVPLKNIEVVIRATARLAQMGIDVETEIAGTGPSESALRELATKLGVDSRVRFLGWQGDVGALLSTWHLLLMPSMHEGFPLAALEAMGSARAVFASQVGGLCELVADEVTGRLLPPGDIDQLVLSIAEINNDRERLTCMGTKGWERAKKLFSLDRATRSTIQLYNRLLNH
jgi:glycosyltransferase involved in cell wall biosynthesis